MKKWNVKTSLEKSHNLAEQKRKNDHTKILHKKTNTLTINASNFVREQLIRDKLEKNPKNISCRQQHFIMLCLFRKPNGTGHY